MTELWAARAAVAERAAHTRHVRHLWGLPGTRIGRVWWPTVPSDRLSVHWQYWWQAHLLDCAVDAQLRAPAPWRRAAVAGLVRGIRLRNGSGWVNRYYDDVAWLGLALQRSALVGVAHPRAERAVAHRLREGSRPEAGGGIRWRVGDEFTNVPATGPAAIFFARRADTGFAAVLVDWIADRLVDPATGLAWDGARIAPDGTVTLVEEVVYTYCQGVLVGGSVELAVRTGRARWAALAERTIAAVDAHLTVDGVLRGHGDGDGGLFGGILARYLALAATALPASAATAVARRLVLSSAEAAWRNRAGAVGGPLFGPEWSEPAQPARGPDRGLSVQLAGWMLLEAASLLERTPAPG